MVNVKITGEYIILSQLLKMTSFIQSGDEAKFVVRSLKVNVNGEQESRRERRPYAGDIIGIEDNVSSLS